MHWLRVVSQLPCRSRSCTAWALESKVVYNEGKTAAYIYIWHDTSRARALKSSIPPAPLTFPSLITYHRCHCIAHSTSITELASWFAKKKYLKIRNLLMIWACNELTRCVVRQEYAIKRIIMVNCNFRNVNVCIDHGKWNPVLIDMCPID